ncbi:hypothetical protein [uncultured Cohaesibacter sp.]|uniref:hypothetical protein n=1 Tax=uncultured Cohaesibacter sp. TaxID=1002546 RepID=UPI002930A023|nr:hypothetical protein [uncultured Cohaesibacter sp.]
MSGTECLGSAIASTNMAQGKMELGATLTKIAQNADNNIAGVLDALVQRGLEASTASTSPGLGENLDIKA